MATDKRCQYFPSTFHIDILFRLKVAGNGMTTI